MNHLHECQPLLPFSAERDRSISIDACVLLWSTGTVEFAGGDAVAVDAIIFCTGYLYTGMLPPPTPPPSLFLSNTHTHARARVHAHTAPDIQLPLSVPPIPSLATETDHLLAEEAETQPGQPFQSIDQ